MAFCANSQIEYTLKIRTSRTKSGCFGLIGAGAEHAHLPIIPVGWWGDIDVRYFGGLTTKVAANLKDHFMFQKFSKK